MSEKRVASKANGSAARSATAPGFVHHQAQVLSSSLLSTLDMWRGTMLVHAARQPKKRLRLFDLEGDPACHQVRAALTALGLDADIYPCPIGGTRYRPKAEALAGDAGFPLLVDANTGDMLTDGPTIVAHLFRHYADRAPPAAYRSGPVSARLAALAARVRGGRGLHARAARRPRRRLQLWSFESSPYARLVRERLTELELGYTVHNVGKEHVSELGPAAMRLRPGPYRPRPGGRRAELLARWGRVQLPYLEDPNTGVGLFESADIIAYLEHTYARAPLP